MGSCDVRGPPGQSQASRQVGSPGESPSSQGAEVGLALGSLARLLATPGPPGERLEIGVGQYVTEVRVQRSNGVSHLQAIEHVLGRGVAVPLADQLDGVALADPALRGGRAHPELHVLRGV